LTDAHPIRLTSIRCHSARQHNPAEILVSGAEFLFRQPGPPQYARANGTEQEQTERTKRLAETYHVPQAPQGSQHYAKWFGFANAEVGRLHKAAKEDQRAYHLAAGRCVASAASSLFVLALSITVLDKNTAFKTFAALYEIMAIGMSWWQWRVAKARSRRWVLSRTRVELLRQWLPLTILFGLQQTGPDADAKTAVAEQLANIDKTVGGTHRIGDAVKVYWDDIQRQCRASGIAASMKPSDLVGYVSLRPLRQLDECKTQQRRLRSVNKGREFWLRVTLKSALGLAVLKFANAFLATQQVEQVTFYDGLLSPKLLSPYLSMGLLTLTASSIVLTALYMGRNDRSLSHRYASHERNLDGWFAVFANDSLAASQDRGTQFAEKILLLFEDFMIEEHIDWIHITLRDVVEPG
jgi:hypothetical protein